MALGLVTEGLGGGIHTWDKGDSPGMNVRLKVKFSWNPMLQSRKYLLQEIPAA